VKRLVRPEAFPDSFTLLPLIRLEKHSPGTNLDLILLAVCAAALLAFAFVPRRYVALLPIVLVTVYAALSVEVTNRIAFEDRALEAQSSGPYHRWIDERADGPTAYLYIGEFNWPSVWENLFWNRRVEHVYDLLTARIPGGLPQDSVGPLEDGRLVLVDGSQAQAAYVVSQYPVQFRGRPLASAGEGLQLWRLDPPLRISVWTQRVPGHVRVLAYACRRSRLKIEVDGIPGSPIDLRRNDRPYRRVELPESGTWTGTVPAAPPRPIGTRLCTFDVYTETDTMVPVAELTRS
jgi:hypothetical protein